MLNSRLFHAVKNSILTCLIAAIALIFTSKAFAVEPNKYSSKALIPDHYRIDQLDLLGTGYAIEIDKKNGVTYLTGETENHPLIIKFSKSGRQQWRTKSNSTGLGKAIVLDKIGGLFTAGHETKAEGMVAYIAKHWSSDGRQIWKKIIDGPSANFATQLVADSKGNIYVAGFTTGPITPRQKHYGSSDVFIAKYNKQGKRLWIKQLGTYLEDVLDSAAIDTLDNIYLFGTSNRNLIEFRKFVIKLNNNGKQLWHKKMGLGNNNSIVGTAIDYKDNIILLKTTNPKAEHRSNLELISYSKTKKLPSSIRIMDGFEFIDPEHITRAGFAFGRDVFIYINTYNLYGKLIKHDRLDTPKKWDLAFDFATDGKGQICLTGSTHGNFLVAKLQNNFNLLLACNNQ